MSRKLVKLTILDEVVKGQPGEFHTKDISEDKLMTNSHPNLLNHSHYHAFVGGALMDHSKYLGIKQVKERTARGSLWQKLKSEETITPSKPETFAEDLADDQFGIGPQYKGDSFFAAQMRYHQSWFRHEFLKLPYGKGPKKNSPNYYGNMLTGKDGADGQNFLTQTIARVAHERLAEKTGAVDPYRLLHNMLSSQPMCFNLFGPMVKDRELATRLINALVPEHVTEVTDVRIEWAPSPKGEYLDDRTAFDAFVEYRTADANLYALGIETKLTEPFSQNEYDGKSYQRWMSHPASVWNSPTDEGVSDIRHNQLWRDHLLAFSLGHHAKSDYSASRLMVVRHPLDNECASALAGYREHLKEQDTLIDMPLDRLMRLWEESVNNLEHLKWLKLFRLRYLELDRSKRSLLHCAG